MKLWMLFAAAAANRWMPSELYDYWRFRGAGKSAVLDPENFLTAQGADKVAAGLGSLPSDWLPFLVIISHVDQTYKSPDGKVQLEAFARDLANLLNTELQKPESMLVMVFALGEGQAVFHRGAQVRRRLTDAVAARAVGEMGPALRDQRYDDAFKRLLEKLPQSPFDSMATSLGLLLLLSPVLLCLACLRRRDQNDNYFAPGLPVWAGRGHREAPQPVFPTPFAPPPAGFPIPFAPPPAPFRPGIQPTPLSGVQAGGVLPATPFSDAQNLLGAKPQFYEDSRAATVNIPIPSAIINGP